MLTKKPLSRAIYIVAAKRTPFGTFGGALKDLSATDLAVVAAKAALSAKQPSEPKAALAEVQAAAGKAVLVAGASAVQIGTANFYDPTASARLVG